MLLITTVECRYGGYDVAVGVFSAGAGTTLVLDHDSVLCYELQRDLELYEKWLSALLRLVGALELSVCVARWGGLKVAVDPVQVLRDVRAGSGRHSLYDHRIELVIARSGDLPFAEASAIGGGAVDVVETASGRTVMSLFHRRRIN